MPPLDGQTMAVLDAVTDIAVKVEQKLSASLAIEVQERLGSLADLDGRFGQLAQRGQDQAQEATIAIAGTADKLRAELGEAIEGVRGLVAAIEQRLPDLRAEAGQAVSEFSDAAARDVGRLTEWIDALKGDIATRLGELSEQLAAAAAAVPTLREELVAAVAEFDAKRGKAHNDVAKRIDDSEQIVFRLSQVIAGLTSDIVTMRTSLAEQRADIETAAQSAREGHTAAIVVLGQEIAAKLADAQERHAGLEGGLAALNADQETLRDSFADLESRQAEAVVAAGLSMLREDRLDLDEKLFAARRRFDALCEAMEERLAGVKDGEPGPPGQDGEPGPEGMAGRDGQDGADGQTGEPRGLYDPGESYRKLDRVSFNGSEWIAREDEPGPLPGGGWMLGAQGKKGKPGIGILDVAVDGYAFVLELTNGKTVRFDLRAMFERYEEERGP